MAKSARIGEVGFRLRALAISPLLDVREELSDGGTVPNKENWHGCRLRGLTLRNESKFFCNSSYLYVLAPPTYSNS